MVNGELDILPVRTTDPDTFPGDAGAKITLKVELAPPASANGVLSPVVLNPVPDTAALVIVTPVVPAFCNLNVCELGDPTITFVNVAEGGVAVIPDCTPVPVIATEVKAGLALLLIDMLPLDAPALVGANVALKLAVCPLATEIGSVYPFTEYPVPDAESAVTVKLPLPGLLIVITCDDVPPTATLLNGTGLGVTDICGWPEVDVPVPFIVTTVGVEEALLEIVIVPFAAPVAVGAN